MGIADFFTTKFKTTIFRNLLQSHLGEFFVGDLSADQLALDFTNGTAEIQNIPLNVEAINEKLEALHLPFEMVEGFFEKIYVTIPWKSLMTSDAVVEVTALEVTLQPRKVSNSDEDLDGSQWKTESQMAATSMYIAEEAIKNDDHATSALPNGLEGFAKTIESILHRIRVVLHNPTIRIECCQDDESRGIAVELHLSRLELFDDSSRDQGTSVDDDVQAQASSAAVPSIKHIHVSKDITLYTDVFIPCHRGSTSMSSTTTSAADIFVSATSAHSPILRQPSYVSHGKGHLPQEQTHINSNPVMFFMASGEHRASLKTVRNDKVDDSTNLTVDVNLSSVGIYLSPEQIKILIQFATTLIQTVSPDNDQTRGKDLDNLGLLESTIQHQMLMVHPNLNAYGSYTSDMEDLRLGDEGFDAASLDSGMFYSIKGANADPSTGSLYTETLTGTSVPSTYRPDSESLYTGGTPRNRANVGAADRRHSKLRLDPDKSEMTVLNFRIAYLAVLLLNENPSSTPLDPLEPNSESGLDNHRKKANGFLEGFSSHKSRNVTDLSDLRQDILSYCSDSHIKLLSKTIELNVSKTSAIRRRQRSILGVALTVGQMELTEWLVPDTKIRNFLLAQPSLCEIITFRDSMTDSYPVVYNPCLKLEYSSDTGSSRHPAGTPTKFSVNLYKECTLEVDISITDRMRDLIHAISGSETTQENLNLSATSTPLRDDSSSKPSLDFNLQSEHDIVLHLRFPIADLRKDPSQRPLWWKRNLRQELLKLELAKPRFHFMNGTPTEVELQCRSLMASFIIDEKTEVAFANIGQEPGYSGDLEWPRLLIKIYPDKTNSLLYDEQADSYDSNPEAFKDLKKTGTPSPFSSTKAMLNDNEELQIPGTKREVETFEFLTENNTVLYINLDLQCINIIMPSKSVLELLYNRVCNDLLLWEPLAPSPVKLEHSMAAAPDVLIQYGVGVNSHNYSLGLEDDLDEEESLFSIRDGEKTPKCSTVRQSKSCVSINIKRGCLTLVHPVLGDDGSIIPDQHGQSSLEIQDGVIYINSKSMGDPNLNYISIHSGQCSLYHDGSIAGAYNHPNYVERLSQAPPNLPLVLSLCPAGVPTKMPFTVGSKGEENMLGIAIKVTLDPDPKKHVKYINIAIALRRACLYHKMVTGPEMWITQLMKFLAVDDYDVLGYPFPRVFTELHFHVLDSAISYIPKDGAMGGLLTLEKFSISSNVIANSMVSLLTFSAEDAAFHLSDKPDKSLLNVRQDYVCLLELNCFRLDWKSSDGKNAKYPENDICINCSTLHIRTCSDSILALQTFILNAYHDKNSLTPPETDPPDINVSDSETEVEDLQDRSGLVVNLADAMEDLNVKHLKQSMVQERRNIPVDTFTAPELYPAEHGGGDELTSSQMSRSYEVRYEKMEGEEASDIEDDFFIVDASEIKPLKDYEVINSDVNHLKECFDYFKPSTSRVNLLLPPKGFPLAVNRLCLENLNIIWGLYGGNDFGPGTRKYSKSEDAKIRGGVARNTNECVEIHLSRVQIHDERYPDDTSQVRRSCVLVDDIEVRDLVSNLNKLLYQFSSSSTPRLQHTSLVSLKVVTRRPDLLRPHHRHEADIRLSVQPIRVNLHQLTLMFLIKFKDGWLVTPAASSSVSYNAAEESLVASQRVERKRTSSNCDAPVMSVSVQQEPPDEGRAVFDEIGGDRPSATSQAEENSTMFIKNFTFSPPFTASIDYVGHNSIDISQRLTGVALALAQLRNFQIKLKALHFNRGVLGVRKLFNMCVETWIKDVTYQIPKVIASVGPMSSLVQFFYGFFELVWQPILQYRKDGRIVRGLQKGAHAFTSSTAVAFMDLTNTFFHGCQGVAEVLVLFISSGTAVQPAVMNVQPRDVRAGFNMAMVIATEDAQKVFSTAIRNVTLEKEAKGYAGALGEVVRQTPKVVIQPAITTTSALSKVVTGARNQLFPDSYREDAMKYKSE